MLMEGDPFTLIEGMVIAGLGVGAEQGYVYLRSEYPDAIEVMERAVEIARAAGFWAT
jgi:formate dehydrogenase iron-sulfur subunit